MAAVFAQMNAISVRIKARATFRQALACAAQASLAMLANYQTQRKGAAHLQHTVRVRQLVIIIVLTA
jgi:hypothetical protein